MRNQWDDRRSDADRRARMIEHANDAGRRGMPVTIFRRSEPEAAVIRPHLHEKVKVQIARPRR